MDWLIGGIVVVFVIAGGLAFAARSRRPERLVTPSPVAGWDEALASMRRHGSAAAPVDDEEGLADTETAAVAFEALPPLNLDIDLELTRPAELKPSARPDLDSRA